MNDLEHALADLTERQPRYRLFQRYYDGKHRLAFATEKFRNAFGLLFQEFADNLCPNVVDALADRLELTGFGVEKGANAQLAQDAWSIWEANRMDVRAGQVHQEALRCGDSYVLVWPGPNQQPTLYPQKAAQMVVVYDEEQPGRIEWAAKVWRTREKRVRVTVYYPDRIEKYVTRRAVDSLPEKAVAFERHTVPGEEWPLPNPWGVVPVFHFANNADIGACGRSELVPAIPIQDALNKSLADMLVGMEFVALPQRYIVGMDPDIDEATGKPKAPFTPGVERLWLLPDGAQAGEFPLADLKQFLTAQDAFRVELARVTGTPLHYMALLTGEPPSGEALKTLEARFTKKARDRQATFGNAWEDALSLALRMAGHSDGAVRLSAKWVDPAPRSEREHAETVETKQRIGLSRKRCLVELGLSEQEVKDNEAERAAEQQGDRALGAALLDAFDRGKDGTEESGPPAATGASADELAKRANAAGTLIRSGFKPEAALRAVGLDPIEHVGLLPITLQSEEAANAV